MSLGWGLCPYRSRAAIMQGCWTLLFFSTTACTSGLDKQLNLPSPPSKKFEIAPFFLQGRECCALFFLAIWGCYKISQGWYGT